MEHFQRLVQTIPVHFCFSGYLALQVFQHLNTYRHCVRSHFLSFILMLNLLAMMTVEPMFHCLADSSDQDGGYGGAVQFYCDAWTDEMSLAYEP